jgi:hypothetical protein
MVLVLWLRPISEVAHSVPPVQVEFPVALAAAFVVALKMGGAARSGVALPAAHLAH